MALRDRGLYLYQGREYSAIDLHWKSRVFALVCLKARAPFTCLYLRPSGILIDQNFKPIGVEEDLEDTGDDYAT